MPSVSIFQPLIAEDPRNFAELEASCGNFIDAWLAAGGEPTDDAVVGFYSIWSQSLDERGKNEDDFYRWAYPLFMQHREEVRTCIEQGLP